MKPIEALIYTLVKRFASEFVPAHLRNEFDVAEEEAKRTLASDLMMADWVEKKIARIDTWQGLLDLPQPESDGEIFNTISAAIYAEQNLEISYQGNDGLMHRAVSPLAIIKRDQVLYVAMRFIGYQDVRLVALHRIVGAKVAQTPTVTNEQSFDLNAYLKDGLPFTLPGEKTFNLHLRFAESVYHSLNGRPLRNITSISEPEDGWFEVKAEGVKNTMELRWWLLGFGDKVRIIEPEAIASELQYLLFDPLTGLLARRACQEHFERLIASACRTESALAVVLVDIDHFKRVNDELGHSAGDQVLQEVSRRLKATCRSMDVVGRWGGEEFLILLPETTVQEAALLSERLRQAIRSTPCNVGDDGASRNVSISIGVTAMNKWPQQKRCITDLIDVLLKEADSALYKAKEARDSVEIYRLGGRLFHVGIGT